MKYLFIFLIIQFAIASCDKDISGNISEEYIVGEWSHVDSSDSLSILTKVRNLSGDEYGIKFNADGSLTEIKNSGWCGTPPIAYGEFGGTWELSNDSILIINSTFWGGDLYMEWKILDLDDHQMTYYMLKNDAIYTEE